ncbi:MAG: SPOR domain-containing protein [Rhodospirillales bacterium]
MALSAKPDMKVSPPDPDDDDNDDSGDTARSGSGTTLKVLGGLVCLTLVAGGIWIGFGDRIMMMLDPADGDVPVVTADPAPIKIRPENPGGMQVPNQGRLVYGVVDGSSTQPRVERLLPSPEKPVAVDEVLKRTVPETSSVVTGTAPRGTADLNAGAPVRLTPSDPAPAPLAPVPSAEDVARLSANAPPPPSAPSISASSATGTGTGMETAAAPAAPSAPPAPAPKPAPQAAPAPEPAPAPAAPAATQTANATPAPESPGADISDTFRVQLAASRSEDAVKSEWDRLRRRHVDLLGELQLQVMRIDLGATKGVFYRLRAGPLTDANAAKALCERLKQRKLGCLVVKPGA